MANFGHFFSKKEDNKFQLPLFTCLILINLAIECSLIFIHVSLKEHNLVHQDRINSLPSSGLQMWPLPFSEKHNITIAIKNMTPVPSMNVKNCKRQAMHGLGSPEFCHLCLILLSQC